MKRSAKKDTIPLDGWPDNCAKRTEEAFLASGEPSFAFSPFRTEKVLAPNRADKGEGKSFKYCCNGEPAVSDRLSLSISLFFSMQTRKYLFFRFSFYRVPPFCDGTLDSAKLTIGFVCLRIGLLYRGRDFLICFRDYKNRRINRELTINFHEIFFDIKLRKVKV